ncbi:UdgX family uracil-DNA binding protein [Aquisalinus flavus]|uniref:Type-4 uracil-DNA glycosylase n=1 Tax=Aquisalinus flavus TaxID=1526572 RepID=A0A8J2V276_9PROT|nr:UdgX family uracil-DNA binding protein [Aquisalinus flavus]MBD0427213.1 UdgX family uracil-DNA binding protein [Aquisalinus flavus]UNE47028.1 UdgX family uracil-DNA binding protein [Aquisalinus flavus]GGC99223.1 uracil-DNA glycosylase [Aquisalinus flavus]
MIRVPLDSPNDAGEWREKARLLCSHDIPPDQAIWTAPGMPDGDLFGSGLPPEEIGSFKVSVPKIFPDLLKRAICHSDPTRFTFLYRIAWRLQRERGLLSNPGDADTVELHKLIKSVSRDCHKMKAFVRFRDIGMEAGRERFAAWFEPDHHIVELTAPFFMRRFANMDWAIYTPRRSVAWDGRTLIFGPGATRDSVPAEDAVEDQWKAYYASIFNPARVKVNAMTSEMPKKYWKNLPEAALIPDLIAGAQARVTAMQAAGPSVPNPQTDKWREKRALDEDSGLPPMGALHRQLARCRACAIGECATQAVNGEGPLDARLMIIGEQPGDEEDLRGRPFVGPAGQLLDKALGEAGIDRREVYVTNAVKHFKYSLRGKRRIHQRPTAGEISQCRDWVRREIAIVQPQLILLLGATAAYSVLETRRPMRELRQSLWTYGAVQVAITVHPSYLLRLPDADQAAAYDAFVGDLGRISRLLGRAARAGARPSAPVAVP